MHINHIRHMFHLLTRILLVKLSVGMHVCSIVCCFVDNLIIREQFDDLAERFLAKNDLLLFVGHPCDGFIELSQILNLAEHLYGYFLQPLMLIHTRRHAFDSHRTWVIVDGHYGGIAQFPIPYRFSYSVEIDHFPTE